MFSNGGEWVTRVRCCLLSPIEGPTFAKFLFQNTKPIITLPLSLLKCCIENKANIALHWAEINIIQLQEGGFVTFKINFSCLLYYYLQVFPTTICSPMFDQRVILIHFLPCSACRLQYLQYRKSGFHRALSLLM